MQSDTKQLSGKIVIALQTKMVQNRKSQSRVCCVRPLYISTLGAYIPLCLPRNGSSRFKIGYSGAA